MKPAIHPDFHLDATVTCTACGAVFHIPSTVKQQHIEICSNCHPVYTGKYRGAVSSGRVERFQKKLARAKELPAKTPKKRRLTPEEKLERKLEEKRKTAGTKRRKTR
jgi:large subunit ribosomal protein L31